MKVGILISFSDSTLSFIYLSNDAFREVLMPVTVQVRDPDRRSDEGAHLRCVGVETEAHPPSSWNRLSNL